VEFRVLGPLDAGDGRESLALGPRRQRALLARLLLDAGRTVSVERLLDDLWGEDLPETAAKMVQIYVSGLRKVLGAERLVTDASGYRLELADGDEIDLVRFERMTADGRAALASGDPITAAARLHEALELWRGPALAEFAAQPFGRAEGQRLDGLRLAALEDRIEADLAAGRAARVVAELDALAERHPLRERVREQLMRALYRAGRPGDALAAYHDFRRLLDEQLGIAPSPRLRALEQAILTHDPGLDEPEASPPADAPQPAAPPGRAAELETLRDALRSAALGRRRLVLVSGEPGIGKSRLVEALVAAAGDALVIRGQCVEPPGAGEPYLPLLDGLGGVAEDDAVAATLVAHAPSWLPHLPALAARVPEERAQGATGERLLREMIATLEALAAGRPVVLVVEDMQWADPSTRGLLGALLRRRHPARLLVVATAPRHDELVVELRLRGAAEEVVLGPLEPAAAAEAYGLDDATAGELVRRGGGNPLFMRHLADHLRTTGRLEGVPATLRAALQTRLDALGAPETELLKAAAVAGLEFTTAETAAALGRPVERIDAPGVVEPRGAVEWPDGTRTTGFKFAHALFRDVLLESIAPPRRADHHVRIAERLEAAFGVRPEAARAIAGHYLAGRRPVPAVRFLRLAADECVARRAYQEAIGHLRAALEAAGDLPDRAARLRAQTELRSQLGQALVAIDGWSSPEALACLEQARAAAESLDDREPLASVSLALATLREVRGEPGAALEAVAAGADSAHQGVERAELLACALFHQGAFTRALEQADRGVAELERSGDTGHYSTFPAMFGDNAGVACHDWAALSLWFLGHAGEAMRRAGRALELSGEPDRAYSAATASAQLAALHACRGEPREALRWAQATVDAARDRGYAYRVAMGRVLRGWARAAEGHADGVDEIACALRASRAAGAHLEDPFYLGLLADAHLRTGATEPGLAAVEEALGIAARERAHYYDAELYRLRGELLLAEGRPLEEVEAPIRQALEIARRQGARSLELRAALALARALSEGPRAPEGRAAVAVAHEPLAAEDTPDVRAAASLLSPSESPAAPGPGFERRRISVLAWEIDAVGDLAERLEPERVADAVRDAHAAVREAALREGGHVAAEDEAGGMLYFGYPRAQENAALRAVRTAWALAEDVTVGDGGTRSRVRAGVDTGPAVIGPLATTALAIGQAPRTAGRLAADAPPGSVLVSDATRALSAGYFTFAPLAGGHRVLALTGARSRLEASTEELSPLVGRARELDLLQDRWEQVAQGLGQAVFLTGDPGIGKSRLVRELIRRLGLDDGEVLEFQCAEAHDSSALHPVADHFRRRLDDRPGGVEALLAAAGIPPDHAAPAIAALLGEAGAEELDPQELKRRTTDVVASYVLGHAAREPVLTVVEDAHWADPSTLELVDELLDAIPDARVLLIITQRPTPQALWEPRSHFAHLSLSPCTPAEAAELVAHLVPAALPPPVARMVVERSDGVPLFIEELARAAAADAATEIPATLDDLLMARLDALGSEAKTVAQVGALIGREFPHDLLAGGSTLPPAELENGLERLLGAGLLRRRGHGLPRRYAFRHALLQEAVTRSLAGGARRALHRRIAHALEHATPELARAEPETVARHHEQAGEPGRAVAYRTESGLRAIGRSAHQEAIDQLAAAVADLTTLPDDDGRVALELDLRVLLGSALISVRGYASPEVEACYGRARELSARAGDDARLLPVLYGLWVNAFVRARHEQVLALGLELRALAEQRDPRVLIVAERAVGWPLVCMGRFAEAREHLDRVLELQALGDQRPLRLLYGQDPAVAGLATGAWALWGCGEGAAADVRSESAIALARPTGHPLSLAYALGSGALLAAFRGDAGTARGRAVEAMAVAGEYGLALWRAWSQMALGAAELLDGNPDGAAVTLRNALSAARATGSALFEPFALTTLAEAELAAGDDAAARRSVAAADDAARAGNEVFWQPRLDSLRDLLHAPQR
jgi:predicted ATPase/DNA-binding SARP family transcriptional activator